MFNPPDAEPKSRSRAPTVINTAGERERETRSRRANLVEALAVEFILLTALWCIAYPGGVLLQIPGADTAARAIIGALLCFAMFVSPRLHHDTLKSWGIGNPAALWRNLRSGSRARGIGFGALMIGLIAALTFELYLNATGAMQFMFGVEPGGTLDLQHNVGGRVKVLVICASIALVWVTCLIRYDNFRSALKAAGKILAVLLPFAVVLAWLVNGSAVFSREKPENLIFDGLGYIFWGAVQQLIFCSYFGTRLRRSFAPAASAGNRNRKRLAVAVFNGFLFGLIHINSWLLAGFAWVLGVFLSWFFMEDRYRNLQALGFVHGVLGTCVIWLFGAKNDPIRVQLQVGPWGMAQRLNPIAMAACLALVVGFGVATIWAARTQRRSW